MCSLVFYVLVTCYGFRSDTFWNILEHKDQGTVAEKEWHSHGGRVNSVPIVRDRDVGFASIKTMTPARAPSLSVDAVSPGELAVFVLSMMAKARFSLVCASIPLTNDAMKLS